VAGDVRTESARQLISAAGDGATAAIAAEHYLGDLHHRRQSARKLAAAHAGE
jgi:thioredoxin reductase